ncbi:MAG: hypothetical protein Q8J78_13420 [Moraxellaceae bacterium]|nr:hypothetical protein [Moraxellaceae bacterium]
MPLPDEPVTVQGISTAPWQCCRRDHKRKRLHFAAKTLLTDHPDDVKSSLAAA